MDKTIGQEYRSVVTKVTANGVDKDAYGLLYKYEYEMQDGTVLSARHKSEHNKLPEGTEVEYVIRGSNDYGTYGKVSKPFDGDRSNGMPYSPNNNAPSNPPSTPDNNRHKSIVWQSLAKVAAALLTRQDYNPDEAVKLTDFLVSYHDWVVAGRQGEKPVYNKVAATNGMPF